MHIAEVRTLMSPWVRPWAARWPIPLMSPPPSSRS